MISLVAGAATIGFEKGGLVLATILFFLTIRLIVIRFSSSLVKVLPYIVFGSVLAGNLLITAVTTRDFALYHLSMVAVEAGLSFILTMIFLQSVPLISMKRRKQALKTEEMISLIILLASILTFGSLFANMGMLGSILGFMINVLAIIVLIVLIRKIFKLFTDKKKRDANPWQR
jgi:stage II sporulation protein E